MVQSQNPIRAYRLNHEPPLKLKDLAEKVGTSKANLSRIERGQPVSESLLPKLQAETGISAAELRPDLAELFREQTQ